MKTMIEDIVLRSEVRRLSPMKAVNEDGQNCTCEDAGSTRTLKRRRINYNRERKKREKFNKEVWKSKK
jgi:hypothetical protein